MTWVVRRTVFRKLTGPFWGAVCLAFLLICVQPRATQAGVGEWTSGGPPEAVAALALRPGSDQEVLAAGRTTVWRSANGGGSWSGLATVALAGSLAYDPLTPGTVYGASEDRRRVMKSMDGGATWTAVFTGGGSTQIRDVLPDPDTAGLVLAAGTAADGLAQLWRSTDGGATWSETLGPNQRGAGGIGQTMTTSLAAAPGVPGERYAGLQVYHGGSVLKTTDGGATWATAYGGHLTPLAFPVALAVARRASEPATIYASFTITGAGTLVRSDDGGATWVKLPGGPPFGGQWTVVAMATNPSRPDWVYAAVTSGAGGTSMVGGLFASDDRGQVWHRLGEALPLVAGSRGLALSLPSRTLFASTSADQRQGVRQLTIAWPAAPRFGEHYQSHDGYRLLGTGISLESLVGGYPGQYFEKGRLEDHAGEAGDPNWWLMYGLLVDELHAARASLPVGGDVSALTYAGVNDLAGAQRREAPPPGYAGSGTHPVEGGGMFIPFTADLSGAPGHVVPAFFWEYINRADLFPGGWLHDVGLPLTQRQQVEVTKYLPEGPAQRTIWVQAFQRTILTWDALNPPDWQVERANVGSDYRRQFPDRVGP